ncbi:MAG: HepT-like ribonuclease domain-containing protein [Candidatus Thorarchaeota archaeon]
MKGIYYDLSSAIDAVMDIIAILCKDLGTMPRGDYENIENLQTRDILSADLVERLANCNGLRNVLVHQYNGIDENLVLESTQPVERDLREFVKVVEEHITKH